MNLIQKKWKISFRIICQCFSTVPFESLYKVDHHTKKAQTRFEAKYLSFSIHDS